VESGGRPRRGKRATPERWRRRPRRRDAPLLLYLTRFSSLPPLFPPCSFLCTLYRSWAMALLLLPYLWCVGRCIGKQGSFPSIRQGRSAFIGILRGGEQLVPCWQSNCGCVHG
jgi:hypothetical protein